MAGIEERGKGLMGINVKAKHLRYCPSKREYPRCTSRRRPLDIHVGEHTGTVSFASCEKVAFRSLERAFCGGNTT